MVYERNALMETVYPELKNFCKESYRLEFQVRLIIFCYYF